MLLFLSVRATTLRLSMIPLKREDSPRLKLFRERSTYVSFSVSFIIFASAFAEWAPKPCSLSTSLDELWSRINWLNLMSCSSILLLNYKSFCLAMKSLTKRRGRACSMFLTGSSILEVCFNMPNWLIIAGSMHRDASDIERHLILPSAVS